MHFTYPEKKSRILQKIVIGVLCVGVFSFIGSKVYPIIHGPTISVDSLDNGTRLTEPMIHLSGKAQHTKDLIINGASLAINPNGSFDEYLVLNPGYNIITMEGRDRFGTVTTKNYSFLLTEQPDNTFTINTLPITVN